MDSSSMVKLIIMLAMVCFPVAHPLPPEASPLPQNSTHLLGPLPVHSHFLVADCEHFCHDVICKRLHGLPKTLCVIGCTVGCTFNPPDKTPADNPTFRRLHSCGVKTCAKFLGKNGTDINGCTTYAKKRCGELLGLKG